MFLSSIPISNYILVLLVPMLYSNFQLYLITPIVPMSYSHFQLYLINPCSYVLFQFPIISWYSLFLCYIPISNYILVLLVPMFYSNFQLYLGTPCFSMFYSNFQLYIGTPCSYVIFQYPIISWYSMFLCYIPISNYILVFLVPMLYSNFQLSRYI